MEENSTPALAFSSVAARATGRAALTVSLGGAAMSAPDLPWASTLRSGSGHLITPQRLFGQMPLRDKGQGEPVGDLTLQ